MLCEKNDCNLHQRTWDIGDKYMVEEYQYVNCNGQHREIES
jgi:hypothetical protein